MSKIIKLFVLLLAASCFVVPVCAQVTKIDTVKTDMSKVKVEPLEVRTPSSPKPLTDQQKLFFANRALQLENISPAKSLGAPIKLSVSQLKSGNSQISFDGPLETTDSKPNALMIRNYVTFKPSLLCLNSCLAIKPEVAPGYYFFDISLDVPKSNTTTRFEVYPKGSKTNLLMRLEPEDELQKFSLVRKYDENDKQHFLFVLHVTDISDDWLFVSAGREWKFYSCEISRIEQ